MAIPKKTKEVHCLIQRVEVKELFGLYDYCIEPKASQEGDHGLILLYGENGAGKSTILKLVFHLINPVPFGGHRTYVSTVPFKWLRVVLTSGFIVIAEKKDPFDGEEYVVRVTKSDGRELTWKWLKKEQNIKSDRNYSNLCEAFQQEGYRFHYLSDSRRVEGLSDANRSERIRRSHLLFEDDEIIMQPSSDSHETLLLEALERTIQWFRKKAVSGTNAGHTSVNAIYSELIASIVAPESTSNIEADLPIVELTKMLEELRNRNSMFSEYGLTPELNTKNIVKLLKDAVATKSKMLNTVLRPYLDGHNARLDALFPLQKIIDEFVRMLREFFANKKISIDIGDSLRITTEGGRGIGPEQLSSGEKQLLLLFCNAIIARQDGTILIIDEPEISLNVKWQRNLVSSLLALLEGVESQVIIATHSIEILSQFPRYVAVLQNEQEHK